MLLSYYASLHSAAVDDTTANITRSAEHSSTTATNTLQFLIPQSNCAALAACIVRHALCQYV